MKALIWVGGVAAAAVLSAGTVQAQTVLADATVGQAYTYTLPSPGLSPVYSVSAGSLPDGIMIASNALSGVPTTAGPYAFTIRADYSVSCGPPIFVCPQSQSYSYTLQVQSVVAAVPTLGEWAMMGLTAALALIGVALVSRRFVV